LSLRGCRPARRTPRRALCAGLACVLSVSPIASLLVPLIASARAQELRVPGVPIASPATPPSQPLAAPPVLIDPQLTLVDAVRLTLTHSPIIARARENVGISRGRLRELKGAFDLLLRVTPGGEYLHQELEPSLRGRELNKRRQLEIVFGVFDALNKGIGESLDSLQPRAPFCPPDLLFVDETPRDFITDRRDPAERRLAGLDRDFRGERVFEIVNGVIRTSVGPIRLNNICRAGDDKGTGQSIDFWRRVNNTGRYGLDAVVDGLSALPVELSRFAFELSETLATRTRLALERLGPVPHDEIRKNLFLEASVTKPLRNGLSVSLESRFESEERTFKDKPLDPGFGGFEIRPRFPSFVSTTFDVPLAQGRGRTSAAAPERAASLTADARRAQLQQIVSEEVFRTVLAYENLIAAQDIVALLEESGNRQQSLVSVTKALFDTGDVPGVDVDRARARSTAIASALADSRLDLLAARASLTQVMGVDVNDFNRAPIASEPFAEALPSVPGADAMIQLALARRADPRALRSLRDASRVLAAAAAADLRRRVDLAVTAGYSTLYESPFARFLPDEASPIFSDFEPRATVDRRIPYYSGRGFARSLTGEWKPFVKAEITFDLPFGNRTAKGRATQASASAQRSEIEATDLERVIRDNVTDVTATVRLMADAIARRREAVDLQQETLNGALEQFKIGELTLLDTLTTEQGLTDERVQLVRDRQVYVSAVARLKFETGTLITFEQADTANEVIRFPRIDRLQ